MDKTWFFDGWDDLARVTVLGVLGYIALIAMLRVARKRTLAQMNVFDFVYIVVMGELLAITILSDDVPLAKGLLALAVLIAVQTLISWLTTRSKAIERIVNGEPTLLFHRGRFLRDTMQAQRVTEEEIRTAMREEGVADVDEVEAVVLETNGSFSVLHFGTPSHRSTLCDVPGADRSDGRADGGRAPASHHAEQAGATSG